MGKHGRRGKRRKLAEALHKLLKETILKRYDNNKFWDPNIPKKGRTKNILFKYDTRTYWDGILIKRFQKEHNLDNKQIEDLLRCIINEIKI